MGVTVPDGGGPHVRVHQVEIHMRGCQALDRGERVSFAIEQHDDGPYATAVTPSDPSSPRRSWHSGGSRRGLSTRASRCRSRGRTRTPSSPAGSGRASC
ncbi:cold shock domain-containing protein [Promicromonospora sp. NPDC057138]|uniref:cold shock domain-containing protein n=1 Tax=Promicromonospora sp. NPDC057138 TaxID=3346031 RepID=UPI00363DB043